MDRCLREQRGNETSKFSSLLLSAGLTGTCSQISRLSTNKPVHVTRQRSAICYCPLVIPDVNSGGSISPSLPLILKWAFSDVGAVQALLRPPLSSQTSRCFYVRLDFSVEWSQHRLVFVLSFETCVRTEYECVEAMTFNSVAVSPTV